MRVDTMHLGAPAQGYADRVTSIVITLTMLVLALSGWVAYLGFDMDALALEAVKTVGPFVLGGIVGYYAYGRLRGTRQV